MQQIGTKMIEKFPYRILTNFEDKMQTKIFFMFTTKTDVSKVPFGQFQKFQSAFLWVFGWSAS